MHVLTLLCHLVFMCWWIFYRLKLALHISYDIIFWIYFIRWFLFLLRHCVGAKHEINIDNSYPKELWDLRLTCLLHCWLELFMITKCFDLSNASPLWFWDYDTITNRWNALLLLRYRLCPFVPSVFSWSNNLPLVF